MKTRIVSSRRDARIPAVLAILGLAACQNPETTPVSPGQSETDGSALHSEDVPRFPQGRKATDAELARYLATHPEISAPGSAVGPAPLAKASANDTTDLLPVCNVDFNDVYSLAAIPDQAYLSVANAPYYQHSCNFGKYLVSTQPVNNSLIRLLPENSNWCSGSSPLIGTFSGGSCVNQTQGKYWPRRGGNMGANTGVHIYAASSVNFKNFNIKSLYIHSGDAELEAYRPGIGLWMWHLFPGTNYFPEGTKIANMTVYRYGRNGHVSFDNLKISIIP